MADVFINGEKVQCLCDTGPKINLLPTDFAEKHCLSLKPVNGVRPVSVDQTSVHCAGDTDVHIQVGSVKKTHRVSFMLYKPSSMDFSVSLY